jgi:hypothetical protein
MNTKILVLKLGKPMRKMGNSNRLKWIVKVSTGFNWLRAGSPTAGFCEHGECSGSITVHFWTNQMTIKTV